MRLSEWLEDEKELAREEGMKEGKQEGLQEFLVTLVCKKLIKGESC